MATFDESPTVCQGQPWAHWAERIGFRNDKDVDKEGDGNVEKQEGDTMKLRKEDMSLFGFCPARDDFYLVVCEICRQVVKPQALKSHIELRHGGVSPPKSEKMERQNKTVSSSQDISQLSPSKQQKSGPPFSSSPKHSTTTSTSSTTTSAKSHSKHESKSKRNHSLAPVVRVERMSPNIMLKKSSSGLANNTKMTGVNSNLMPVDKRELPSPQQPPPNPPPPAQNATKKGSTVGEPRPKPATVKANSKTKVPKERKLLLCKDRIYDPNKHCGVWNADVGKQCTRSLTCKTHSLALRRSVLGRRKNFDELLADHRAAKEALLKATQASKEAMQASLNNSNSTNNNASTAKNVANKLGQSTNASQKVMPSPVKPKSSSKATSASSLRGSNISGVGNSLNKDGLHPNNDVPGDRTEDKSNASIKNKNVESPMFVTNHPRPAAMCTYGSRHMGLGFYVFNRNMDHVRTVLRTAFLDRSSHPPPTKKLCVESKLPPVPDFSSDPSDPYNFSWVDQQTSTSATSLSGSVTNTNVGNVPELSSSIPTSVAAASISASALKNCQTKSNKTKNITSKTPKDVNTVNRTNANSVKRKRTNTTSCASAVVSTDNVVVTSDLGTTTLPVAGNVQRNSTLPIAKVVDANRMPQMRNNSKLQTALGTVPIKNHSYPSSANKAFRDLNIVVTSLDVANGQIPANSGAAVLSRSLSGFHTFTNVTASGVPITSGLNIANTTVAAVQQHIERNANKKNKNISGKGAKNTANQESNRPANMINPYLPGILTSGGVLVEGLQNAVSLPVVNNVAVGNNIAPQTQIVTSTASPLLRSESASPQIPTSSPLANGLGPSPPPPSTIHSKIINNLLQGTSSVAVSPARLSSPGVEIMTGNVHSKGKNSMSKHNACSPKGSTPNTCKASTVSPLLAGSAQLPLNRTGSVPTRPPKTTPVAISGITFQQVYANQVLASTPLGLQLPSNTGTIRTLPASTPPPFTMRNPLPLNILTTAVPASVTTDAESPGQPQSRPSFLLQTEDLRHPEVQGSPSLHT